VKEKMLWDYKIPRGWVVSQNALSREEMKSIFVAHCRAMPTEGYVNHQEWLVYSVKA
jgi:hypothetical protein